jgi:hypothetical protein
MNYSNVEDVYGTPFGRQTLLTDQKKEAMTNEKNPNKIKSMMAEVAKSLPLDTSGETENFRVQETPLPIAPQQRQKVQERFSDPNDDKLSRILRLIEQNRTGYERPATQDMVLYVFTGIFFLFTLDTFVLLGKSMRGK